MAQDAAQNRAQETIKITTAPALPALGADKGHMSVSGLSSGAFMAVQYGVAFASSTIGVGVVAGGPYNCAFVNLGSVQTCLTGNPSGAASLKAAQGFAFLGQIDSPAAIAAQRIYLFSGTKDTIVKRSVVDATQDFYLAAGVPAGNIHYTHELAAGHAFISNIFGNACPLTRPPFIDQCSMDGKAYDQPQAILTQIYGPLRPEAVTLSSQPEAFDQSAYRSADSSLAARGYVYVPAQCRNDGNKKSREQCPVHVVFHGCQQGADVVGDAVYSKLGYNEWADSNSIIMLYPQIEISEANPQGCWDWWGYSGLNFQVRSGPQLSAVHAMVERLEQAP
ncbi:extracellular catalytic domain type 2 short-chain-length polyhydroxyalkanoate depolymerase [Beijerinckia indica]